jgi:hypothetical protein
MLERCLYCLFVHTMPQAHSRRVLSAEVLVQSRASSCDTSGRQDFLWSVLDTHFRLKTKLSEGQAMKPGNLHTTHRAFMYPQSLNIRVISRVFRLFASHDVSGWHISFITVAFPKERIHVIWFHSTDRVARTSVAYEAVSASSVSPLICYITSCNKFSSVRPNKYGICASNYASTIFFNIVAFIRY